MAYGLSKIEVIHFGKQKLQNNEKPNMTHIAFGLEETFRQSR